MQAGRSDRCQVAAWSDISFDILSGTYSYIVSDIWFGIQHISEHDFLAFSSNILSSILSDLGLLF